MAFYIQTQTRSTLSAIISFPKYLFMIPALHFFKWKKENVSSSAFCTSKSYYVSKPTEAEKESCMCIDCLNPQLLLNSINTYRKSISLHEYQSLTTYVNELKVDGDNYDLFRETKSEKGVSKK